MTAVVMPSTARGRETSRRAVRLSCEILYDGTDTRLHGLLTDLSRTGTRAIVGRPIPRGTEVLVCFSLPGASEAVLLGAEVVRLEVQADGVAVGLAFQALDGEMAQLLEECLSRLPPRVPRLEDEVVEIVDVDEEGSGVHPLVDAIPVVEGVVEGASHDEFAPLRDSELEVVRVAS